MVPVKKCFGTGGFSRDSPGSSFEPLNASCSFRANCGSACAPLAAVVTHLNQKSTYGITGRKDEAECMMAIPAVPLRSVPAIDVRGESKESESSHDRDYGEAQRKTKTLDTVHQEEELWNREMKKLEAVIDDAKEFLDLMDAKYPTPIRERGSESVMPQNLDGGVSGKRVTAISEISVDAQGEKPPVTENVTQDEDEDEVSLLSRAEWTQLFNHKKDESAGSSVGKLANNIERHSSLRIAEECKMDLISVGTTSDKPSGRSCDRELTETKCRDICWHDSSDSDDELNMCDVEDTAKYSPVMNHKELINLEIMKHDHPLGRNVMEALKLFRKEYDKIKKDNESIEGKTPNPDMVAARLVKERGIRVDTYKLFGHVPGVEIGDEFSFRSVLATVGLNRQYVKGIAYVAIDGKPYATSVVNSWRYENMATEDDILIYFGEGGNPNAGVKGGPADQKLERGNLALFNSMELGFPIRVIHKRKRLATSKPLDVNSKRNYVYVYDGLYKVNRYWHERENGKHNLAYKFELQRLPEQPKIHGTHIEFRKQIHSSEDCDALQGELITEELNDSEKDIQPSLEKETFEVANGVRGPPRNHGTDVKRGKQIQAMDVCVLDDVSKGKEKFKVRVVNGVDDDLPPPFTYITEIVYPKWSWLREPIGCDCTDGCSDHVQCPCVVKNGDEIPYTEKGELMRAKPNKFVHECGPSCKCPPSCMNRVSQHGPCIKLEIFKTKTMGWGVRSRDYIKPGTFICEYMGELLGDEEADQRIDNDQYLFDLCHGNSKEDGFALDAAKFGNIGRFINHSCDPNVFSQKVLYDHDEKRMPHIMFFASKRIPPRQELTYDYNYTRTRVRDANGNIKRKACHCGSSKCTGRLY